MTSSQFPAIALHLCGEVNPESIEDYVAKGGYAALRRAMEMSPEGVLNEVAGSGLRGRGGAGFRTAEKWRLVAAAAEKQQRFVVCNAYDADVDAPVGRTLLEQNPHRVLEGLSIAAYACGADRAYVYCRGEVALAVARMRRAIVAARERGILGPGRGDEDAGRGDRAPTRSMATSYEQERMHGRWERGISTGGVDVQVAFGWSGFVGGEETTMLAAIEGRRAMPRPRPPYPTRSGLWGQPTAINSAETLACVPWVLENASSALASIGSSASPGTKVVAITGDAEHRGLFEVPFGMPLGEILSRTGNGPAGEQKLKAIQVGGPTGGCLKSSALDTPLDFETLEAAGTILGSGQIRAIGEKTCMVGFARQQMSYLCTEACGECVPCRLGTKRMADILEGITGGLGRAADLDTLKDVATKVSDGSLCGFGVDAPNVVLTTLQGFEDEYHAHVDAKRCPTGDCAATRRYRYERRTVL
ncbi:MAG: NADH-quinone oxidoreductase subunit F [Chloroflexi bacterium]|nr:NADH-quinone oxidoreductase subunit F [Chloroflexota bacterium]